MYYDNKFGFYIKQYGTQIVVGIVCLIIVLSGLFLYFKINDKTQTNNNLTGSEVNNVETNVAEDDSILPEELRKLKAGEKITVKVASVDNNGVIVLLTDSHRINAKLIGADFSEVMPDTVYFINDTLQGKYITISFDEAKVSNGYAMIYVYQEDMLYNAQILQEGRLVLDSTVSKKAIEYNNLAESQAYAKQTLAGVWGNK